MGYTLEFKSQWKLSKNIFFVASCQRKGRQSASFLRWLGYSPFRSSLRERSDAELGSHSPLGDRQGSALVLPFSVRRVFGRSKPLPYGQGLRHPLQFSANALQSSRFYDILITERRWGYEMAKIIFQEKNRGTSNTPLR